MLQRVQDALRPLSFYRVRPGVRGGPILETRWYTDTDTYVEAPSRTFTAAELNQHIEVHATEFTFQTTNTPLRDVRGDVKGMVSGSSANAAVLDPVTLTLSKQPSTIVPRAGDLVCGIVKTERFANQPRRPPVRTFDVWFICSEQFMRAWTLVMYDQHSSFEEEPKLRRKAFSGNRLCTNTYRKWVLSHTQNDVAVPQSEIPEHFYHLRTETPSVEWVHVYAAIVLMARYGEIPNENNVPQNLDGSLALKAWDLPTNYVGLFTNHFGAPASVAPIDTSLISPTDAPALIPASDVVSAPTDVTVPATPPDGPSAPADGSSSYENGKVSYEEIIPKIESYNADGSPNGLYEHWQYKPISRPKFTSNCDSRWIVHLATGRKCVEGRLHKAKWADVVPGDIIAFAERDTCVTCRVVECHRFATFGDLYVKYGQQLLPGVETKESAEEEYRIHYTDEDVAKHGVVGIVLKTARDLYNPV